MAKKKNKIYVVTSGLKTGIFNSWPECEAQVKGVPGGTQRGFPDLESAQKYWEQFQNNSNTDLSEEDKSTEEFNEDISGKLMELGKDEVLAATDGSYQVIKGERRSAYGVIILDNQGIETQLYEQFTPKTKDEEFLSQNNVTAELEGVKAAINWAVKYKKTKITVLYDCQNIKKWATGEFKAKNKYTKEYVDFIFKMMEKIQIHFYKVPSHSGIDLNEKADQLADYAITAKDHKSYDDGSMYFTGITEEEWKTIHETINNELISLGATDIVTMNVVRTDSSKAKMILKQGKNKVTISIYNRNKSYVQGKISSLMSKVLYEGVALCDKCNQSIEKWNEYYRLPIQEEAVLATMKQYLPDLNESEPKLFNTLSSAVYNLMIQGYMPDYTCLLQPALRAFEAYLHRILNGKMGLQTDNDGRNNFGYFGKDTNGVYFCTSSTTSVLSPIQKDYLDELYNLYSRIRHPYSHWSLDPNDTRVIDTIEVSQELLEEALETINKYYQIF